MHVRDGMSQERRHLAALEEGYFNVDEMRFEQLLTQTQDYARLMKFHSTDPRNPKTDSPLFAQDELVVMAQILSVDLQDLEARFTQRLRRELGNHQWVIDETRNPASPLGLIRLLDNWLNLLKYPQSSAGENLYSLLESIIGGLARELENLWLAFGDHLHARQWISPLFAQLIRSERPALGQSGSHTARHDHATSDNIPLDLRAPYASLLKAVDMIQTSARQLLPESLNSQLHDPALGLRVVFIQLYETLQRKLNRFTHNYLDFYFEQVLQAKPRPRQADRVYLIVQPGAAEREILLPVHSEFHAGIDKNSQDIIYASDQEVLINDAQVTHLHTVFFPRDPTRPDERPALANGCWLNTFTVHPNPGKKERDKQISAPFFGASREQKAPSEVISSRLGFAIANKVLLLREGKRKITLTLHYEKIRKLPWSHLDRLLAELPALKDTDTSSKAKFFAYFGNIFQFSLTTAEGWLDIAEYKPAYQDTDATIKDNALQMTFHLTESSPAITPYDPLIHGDQYSSSLPILKVVLKDNYQQYPYDMLKQLVVKEIRIEVDVEGCHDLILHNNIGQLSSLAPFAPFGPIPEVGSYFIVGHEETRSKQLTHFDIDIEWKGLPGDNGGFSRWYQGYNTTKQNHQFQASVSVLADGRWQPGTADASVYQPLFNTQHKNGQELLLHHKKLSAKAAIAHFKPQDHQQAKRPFQYSPMTRAGLFKFTLQEPLGGFGHREYTTLLADVLTHNARVKDPQSAKTLPNAPYTPEISSIRINYSALSVMRLSENDKLTPVAYRDQYFHLYPQGWEAISSLRHPRIYLLPQFDADGSLYIGISGSKFQQLSLFFHLQNNSLPLSAAQLGIPDDEDMSPASLVQWSYLGDNKWHHLASQHILSDSTQGFMQAGIVTLAIPDAISNDNSIMPNGLFWLKISANKALKQFSYLYSVYAQALQASWRSGIHPESPQPMQLAANTIKRTRSAIPGMGGIIQLCPSFGGIVAESKSHLRTRIGERLRHKNRALTPLDYEMLILEQFPQVHKVKCFANLRTQPPYITPGHILIVPVPRVIGDNYKPHFDGHIIQEIHDYIAPLTPERVQISVENPLYEEIQVRCAVRLRKGHHAGKHHNLLNQALCDYLSPWSEMGNNVHFGWNISEQEIKSFIHNLDYIEHVTDFSLLRIAPREDGYFILDDSAVPDSPAALSHKMMPTYVWSTAVPLANHYIQTLDNNLQIVAEVTGYDELEIGSTFIISE